MNDNQYQQLSRTMRNLQLLVLANIFLLLCVLYAYGADLACAPRPLDRSTWWSYRLVDGRQCWYRGKQVVARDRLHWDKVSHPDRPSVAGQPDDLASAVKVIEAVPAFEQAWRNIMIDLYATPWLTPTPMSTWRLQ